MQTNFSKLADEARRDRAHQLLVETSLDFIDIAMHLGYDHVLQLGYNQVSSLNRAVKRWTNSTPVELRASLLADG